MDITDFEYTPNWVHLDELKRALFNDIKDILVDKLGVEDNEVRLESHIMNDLGADSLDGVEIIMEIEQFYDIAIPDDEAENLLTVEDVVDCLMKKDACNLYKKVDEEKVAKEVKPIQIDHSNDKWLAPIEVQETLVSPRKKFVTEIRRFELKENWTENDIVINPNQRENNLSIYGWAVGLKGDILEEVVDRPNTFINVTKLKRENESVNIQTKKMYLSHYINALSTDNTLVREQPFYHANPKILEIGVQGSIKIKKTFDNLRPLNTIQPKDSELLNDLNYNLNSLRNSYKRKLKTLAQINEDITDLEGIFGIENNI